MEDINKLKENKTMAEYQAGRGTTALGIIGTILGSIGTAGVLGNGNILGTGGACHENMPVNRYELGLQQENASLKAQVALRDANTFTDQKMLEMYKYFDGELKDIRTNMCAADKAQAVINAKFESGFGILNTQVTSISNTIANLTKTVIPNSSVCPGYGAVEVRATGCGTCCGYNANV